MIPLTVPTISASAAAETPSIPVTPTASPDLSNPWVLMMVLGGALFSLGKMLLDREQRRLDSVMAEMTKANNEQISALRAQADDQRKLNERLIELIVDKAKA
jgi:hypothetical protein